MDQFALRQASPGHIVGFGVAVTFGPALVLWLAEVLVGLFSRTARRVLHLGVVGLLAAGVAVQAGRPVVTGAGLGVAAVVVGAVAVLALVRVRVVRVWISFVAVAPLGFLALFLLTSPTADLLAEESSRGPVEVQDPPPVVVLVLDELPLESLLTSDGRLDADQYPGFARLAGRSHWFRRTTAVTPATWHAVPTILSGRYPSDGAAPVASHHPDNLFTLLAGSYRLEVTEVVTRLCRASLCEPSGSSPDVWRGLAGDAARVLRSRLSLTRDASDPVQGFAELEADDELDMEGGVQISQPDRFRSLIEGLDARQPALHFLHLLLPHVPYRHLPSGTTYDNPSPDLGRDAPADQWFDESWPVTLGRQRHLLQLRYVDRLVDLLIDELEARGLYDDALVVVTADHGINFRPGGPIRAIEGQELDHQSAADVLAVPFFVKEPGQTEGRIDDRNVLSVDVLPTIADALGVELPFDVDGRSALGTPRPDMTKPYYGNDVNEFTVAVAPPVNFDGEVLWRHVLERSVGALLDDGPPDRIWRIGPSPELVGRGVDDLPAGALDRIDVALRSPEAYASVPELGTKPALVRGRVDGLAPGTPLAIAVNGRVVATGPAYREDGGVAFAVMVDEAALRPGSNDVRVYLIA